MQVACVINLCSFRSDDYNLTNSWS